MTRFSAHRFCIAPMMDWTDRHERFFLRLFSPHAFLYTEMLTSAALLHGDRTRLLRHDPAEHPLGVQLGGSDPQQLAAAARFAESAGYREINLNIGCPSDRVQSGRFGACLMKEPKLVADCVASIQTAVSVPVTVKCRIGVDEMDSDQQLIDFVGRTAGAGCGLFIVHARIALLQGLSPKENREIPPLNYERVYLLKKHYPDLEIIINGGITDLEFGAALLDRVDGIMVGREAYQNPYILSNVDRLLFARVTSTPDRLDYMTRYLPYVEKELSCGTPLHHMTRHILGLFKGTSGGRQFRRHISEHATRPGAGLDVILDALAHVS